MKSMTGFGKATFFSEQYDFDIEVKSVNQRFLDLKINMPKEILHLESILKDTISKKIKRAKVDVRITLVDKRPPALILDENKLMAYWNIFQKARTILQIEAPVSLEKVMEEPGVIYQGSSELATAEFVEALQGCLINALDEHHAMAMKEGASMQEALLISTSKINSSLSMIEECFPEYKEQVYLKLKQQVMEFLKESLNEETERRIITESALYIEKADVNEEIVRLKNHLDKFREKLYDDKNEVGKSINFILQEMQREITTIGSKYNSAEIFSSVLIIKEEIEKCRELIQNVE